MTENNTSKGFNAMTAERRREIAALGGRAAHRLGKAHRWTREEAQIAGRKGGAISRRGPIAEKGGRTDELS